MALDGSAMSEGVLPYAREFAKALCIPLELLQVNDPEVFPLLPEPLQGQYYESEAEIKKQSIAYLKEVAKTLIDIPTVRFLVDAGNPAEVIVDRAAADAGSLIAMTTHGRSGLRRWVLGSVARKVADIAANPILLVRSAEGSMTSGRHQLKTILIPLDGSELAETALPHARELAKKMSLQVVLVRVYDPLTYGQRPSMRRIVEELRAEAAAYLEEKAQQLFTEGIEQVSSMVSKGYPPGEIVDLVERMPDTLVAISTHGRSGFKRWLLGSVAEHVICHARGPVLLIRALKRQS